jgi:hypothetical protein
MGVDNMSFLIFTWPKWPAINKAVNVMFTWYMSNDTVYISTSVSLFTFTWYDPLVFDYKTSPK